MFQEASRMNSAWNQNIQVDCWEYHLISTPCHIAAAVADRQSRCTHRCSDDLGLLVVRNVSEVPGVFCDAPFEATRDIALGRSKIPQ